MNIESNTVIVEKLTSFFDDTVGAVYLATPELIEKQMEEALEIGIEIVVDNGIFPLSYSRDKEIFIDSIKKYTPLVVTCSENKIVKKYTKAVFMKNEQELVEIKVIDKGDFL